MPAQRAAVAPSPNPSGHNAVCGMIWRFHGLWPALCGGASTFAASGALPMSPQGPRTPSFEEDDRRLRLGDTVRIYIYACRHGGWETRPGIRHYDA